MVARVSINEEKKIKRLVRVRGFKERECLKSHKQTQKKKQSEPKLVTVEIIPTIRA